MTAICNQLNVRFNYSQVDAVYDFYLISTVEKYIPFGAKCLDFEDGKVESLAFENGKSLYIMLKKGYLTKLELVKLLDNEKLIVKKVEAADIAEYILFRLFLYSLNNFTSETLSFNNLTGKFYIYKPEWMKKNRSSFTAIGVNVDSDMNIVLEAATFAKYSLFTKTKKINEYPKYVFANKNCSLKRVFEITTDDVYIKKGIYNKKAEVPFFTMSKDDLKKNKVYYLYYVLDLLKRKFDQSLDFAFKELHVNKTIGVERDQLFMDSALREMQGMDINYVNCVEGEEFKEGFESLVCKLQEKVVARSITIGSTIDRDKANILLIHNKEYYAQFGYPDPYQTFERTAVIQCITVEDSAEKIIDDSEAIINTIIKESVIKNDLINKKSISLDDWSSYHFDCDWIFGKEKDGKHYFILIHPDGSYELYNKLDDFSSFDLELLNQCSDYLTDHKGKEKTIIASSRGSINVITRTNRFSLPSKEIFEQEVLSRSRTAREKFLLGVVDINLYEEENIYYSVGIKGSGMNTKIPRAPHLYKIDVIVGENIMGDILSTLSATFVKYKSFTVLPYPIKYLNEYIAMTESVTKEEN